MACGRYRDERKTDKIEWAAHQLLSCYDYNCDSPFWNRFSIHLNNQMCHHLFPSVHPCHYVEVRKILMPVAAKYGIDYKSRSENTFTDAVSLYWAYIFKLNEEEDVKGEWKVVTKSVLGGGAATVVYLTLANALPLYFNAGAWFLA